jgi:hypothetical protein
VARPMQGTNILPGRNKSYPIVQVSIQEVENHGRRTGDGQLGDNTQPPHQVTVERLQGHREVNVDGWLHATLFQVRR